jgi:hypothetical protein
VQLLDPGVAADLDRLLLDPGAGLHDLIPRVEVETLVQDLRHRTTDPGLGYSVSTLLTFAAWREAFT